MEVYKHFHGLLQDLVQTRNLVSLEKQNSISFNFGDLQIQHVGIYYGFQEFRYYVLAMFNLGVVDKISKPANVRNE